ncbi:tripartite tricarboxylate transporter substrate binding protein [Achromobacter spanius]|uniref:ABC transporter substrate-binding protein n=1 Tax=Achromobacter spanius TaxID=217203 RepID=A0A2S0ICN4_9BURK|nr:tripartite tricarboxylate transporter substrate binding protein [Achromobacter spanius]AVJ29728.1 ABC transporter substrate-binding protein [Achromobacter spanius]
MMTNKILLALAASACASLTPITAAAQAAAYPERELNMYVNYGAGGNTDVAARGLARGMEAILNKTVVVQNRAGAQGTLGVSQLAKQKADGYTFGIVTYSTISITPHLMKVDYTADSFDFIAGVGRFKYGVAVRADSPYKTLDDLVKASKAGKGIFFGAPSAPNNIAMYELGRKTGGKFEQVSYKSGAETVSALLGGQVDVIVQNPSDIVPHVNAGKMRMLASASPMRWTELPDIPTMKEQGYDVEVDSWLGLAFPKGVDKGMRDKLEQVAAQALKSPETSKVFVLGGMEPVAVSGAQYRTMLIEGREFMGQAIKAANIPTNQ